MPQHDDLISFADGELERDAAQAFRQHLRYCERCQVGLVEAITLSARLADLAPIVSTSACMAAPTQLDRIEAAQAELAADIAALRSLLQNIVTREIQIMSNQDVLKAALDAVNAATSQEAALLATDTAILAQIQATQASNGPKLDTIQALILDLLNTAGIPQSILDQAMAAQAAVAALVASSTANGTALASVASNTTDQSARLDQLARDPRNPVPTPPPVV